MRFGTRFVTGNVNEVVFDRSPFELVNDEGTIRAEALGPRAFNQAQI